MTTPTPESLSDRLEGMLSEIDTVVGDVSNVLAFVDKYSHLIPGASKYVNDVREIESALVAVKALLDHVPA